MELWQAAILGLVEGVTEYLPVSSTGHLILASALMGLDTPERKAAIDAFEIVVQGGAILAVLGLYRGRILQMLRGLIGRDPAGLRLAVNLVIAFLPAAVLGVLLEKWIAARLFYVGPVLAALVAGGVYMMAVDRVFWARRTRSGFVEEAAGDPFATVTPARALLIGMMQCVAMWPGTSRSMMTITGGMIVGLPAAAAAEFSFLLGLPTLGAATLYKLYKNLRGAHDTGGPDLFHALGVGAVVLGLAVATVSAALAVRWLVGFLNRHGLTLFGWYRIALAAVILLLAWNGTVRIAPRNADESATPGPGMHDAAPAARNMP